MFIRIKKIKGIEYAYLVKSVWENNASRQRVVKYFGKVSTPIKHHPITFAEFCQKENKTINNKTAYKECVKYLMELLLYQHNFIKNPLFQKRIFNINNWKIIGDPEKFKISSGPREITLKVNDGYMNSFTLKEILNIRLNKKTEEQRQAATILAKAFINAGIPIPQDVFIEVFQKVYQ